MIDFTECHKRNKSYGGANGNKISVEYNDNIYMLKFPTHPTKNDALSYTNSSVSEYIGCQIFNMLGIPAQDTLLGTYMVNGKERVVVACRDFTYPLSMLQDFASLKNQIIDSERNGYGTELSDILETIQKQTVMSSKKLEEHFWNVFIIDAFIGNWDRHNGNWGFLYNQATDEVRLAPVYDCGSSLFPQADESIMESVLEDKNQLHHRVYNVPTSAIMVDGKKIRYFEFISSLKEEGCNKALERIVPRINMEKVKSLIEDIPYIDELQKTFYIRMLEARKELILDFSYKKLKKLQPCNDLTVIRDVKSPKL